MLHQVAVSILRGAMSDSNGNAVFRHDTPCTYAEVASLWEFVATFVVATAAAFWRSCIRCHQPSDCQDSVGRNSSRWRESISRVNSPRRSLSNGSRRDHCPYKFQQKAHCIVHANFITISQQISSSFGRYLSLTSVASVPVQHNTMRNGTISVLHCSRNATLPDARRCNQVRYDMTGCGTTRTDPM